MNNAALEQDKVIFHEMMSHPAIFSHPNPQKIAVMGDVEGHILKEVLKHPTIKDVSPMTADKIEKITSESFDIFISATETNAVLFAHYFSILRQNGILIQQCGSLFHLEELKNTATHLQKAGFCDLQIIHFPQPNSPLGSRSALMAVKQGTFNRVREKDIFNKTFKTHYYNFDVHKAALALPEFIRQEWVV